MAAGGSQGGPVASPGGAAAVLPGNGRAAVRCHWSLIHRLRERPFFPAWSVVRMQVAELHQLAVPARKDDGNPTEPRLHSESLMMTLQ